MVLETQDDYQDKIDDLMKEVDRLYDEGTDKGFKLKRGEEMDQELRALDTEKDYQREIDDLEDKLSDLRQEEASLIKRLNKPELIVSNYGVIEKQKKNIKDYEDNAKENYLGKGEDYWLKAADNAKEELKELEEKFYKAKKIVDKLKPQKDAVVKEIKEVFNLIEKLEKEAKGKGFKIKRGEDMDFEARKQEILASLEERAIYKSEKDYIKSVNSLNEKIKELQDEYDRYYSKSAVEKYIKSELESQERIIRNRYEREGLSIKNKIDYNKKLLENAHNEAKKQGFKVRK